ncbi:MAG TPA: carbohydrate kinase family protein [Candidatus Paceibacterota bacterium]|nr:carbohydrate kinase family protein [Candidatus Paceibacterota bacterium]
MKSFDFLAVGDIVTEPFIRLKEASVHCNIDSENCTISMRWGDKIPYESAEVCHAVGNSPNAAVAAARLGLTTGIATDIGNDDIGKGDLAQLKKEKIATDHVRIHKGMVSNYHYVLSYESERTILVKHEEYPYRFPNIKAPRYLYLSSLAANSLAYHKEIEAYLEKNPNVYLTLQPGTFQMKLGVTELKGLYARANLLVINKEEAARILGLPESGQEIKDLLQKTRAFGPKAVIITDGRAGAYAYDGAEMLHIPMYPDDREPKERTGAGDAFASTVTAAMALGKTFREALLWGPINSMAVVQEVGAQKGLLTRAALEAFLAKAPASYAVTSL